MKFWIIEDVYDEKTGEIIGDKQVRLISTKKNQRVVVEPNAKCGLTVAIKGHLPGSKGPVPVNVFCDLSVAQFHNTTEDEREEAHQNMLHLLHKLCDGREGEIVDGEVLCGSCAEKKKKGMK